MDWMKYILLGTVAFIGGWSVMKYKVKDLYVKVTENKLQQVQDIKDVRTQIKDVKTEVVKDICDIKIDVKSLTKEFNVSNRILNDKIQSMTLTILDKIDSIKM